MKKILLLALLIFSNSPVQANLNPNSTSPILKEIPFDFSQNLPIIEVNIKGNNYRFLFDTAAAHTVVSEHLFTELGLNVIKKQSIADSNNNITQLKVCEIDAMSLNGINFQNKLAVVTALDKSYKIGCLNIDGVFGNDVMKDYFWGIDYKKQIITLTDDKFLFNIPEEAHIIKYNTAKHSFTPKVVLKIDGKKVKNLSFDTGYNKSVFLNKSFISDPLNMESTITYYGSSSEGLFGGAKPKIFYRSMLKNVQMGSLKVDKALVTLNDGKPRIGNDFFKDYKVYLDFEDSKIYLVGYSESVEEKVFNSFGLSYIVTDSSLRINTIIKDSSADKNELKINYEILEIDYLTVSSEIKDNPCIFLKEIFKEKETILVKYKTPEGTKGSVVLKKEKLL